MSDDLEIRKAAERYRLGVRGGAKMLAAETLAEAWLQEHPADDDEPISEQWLRSVGFSSEGDHMGTLRIELEHDDRDNYPSFLSVTPPNKQSDQQFYFRAECMEFKGQNSCVWLALYETRGDVRRLCKALGIKLKEVSDG